MRKQVSPTVAVLVIVVVVIAAVVVFVKLNTKKTIDASAIQKMRMEKMNKNGGAGDGAQPGGGMRGGGGGMRGGGGGMGRGGGGGGGGMRGG